MNTAHSTKHNIQYTKQRLIVKHLGGIAAHIQRAK